MTEPTNDPRHDDVTQPHDEGAAPLSPDDYEDEPEQEQDPVTAPQTDPAAMSEHERNAQHAKQYGL